MPSDQERIKALEEQLRRLMPQITFASNVAAALEGRQADATLALPHNDTFPFEDNVDGTHPANLRYVIASNTQRIVSARLSIHLAPYRTYNTLSVSATGNASNDHNHSHNHGSHAHNIFNTSGAGGAAGYNLGFLDGGGFSISVNGAAGFLGTVATAGTTPATDASGQSQTHTHNVSASGVLGVTEGATAAGVTIAFDGTDQTAVLGGPFNADAIELNVLPYLVVTRGVWHTIAIQPSGLGRIEAHLRLGVYVSAAQPI